jgi:hypothetical protein
MLRVISPHFSSESTMNPPVSRFQTARKLAWMGVLSLCLGMLPGARAFAQNELPPTQVLNLYLKALINQDIRSATEINDYMRPLVGQNVFNLQAMMEMKNDGAPTDVVAIAKSGTPAATPEQTEHERLFIKALMAAVRRSSCQVVGSEVTRDAATGAQTADVEYVCLIPDAHISSALNAFENDAASDAAKTAIMGGIVEKLNTAPTKKEIFGALQLQETKADGKSYWRPVSVEDTLNLVLGSLLTE